MGRACVSEQACLASSHWRERGADRRIEKIAVRGSLRNVHDPNSAACGFNGGGPSVEAAAARLGALARFHPPIKKPMKLGHSTLAHPGR